MIRVEQLGKRFGSIDVLRDVSFSVPRGATASILGPSGGGKSTLLRCLVGLEAFDRGTIFVDDTEVCAGRAQRSGQAKLRGRVGLVFQSFELFSHLTVLDNCTLAPRLVRHASRSEAEERARMLLEQLGLGAKADAFPEHLSGGQRQRVAIARALCMEPRVLLYDEPTSALDPSLKEEVRDTITAVGKTGVTQIVVTHDHALADGLGGSIFRLEGGQLVY
jgi:ABC-type polar amino acid transport system ATPase subunit